MHSLRNELTSHWASLTATLLGWGLVLGGLAVWVGAYAPTLMSCREDCLYVWARHMFFFNQIVITMFGFILAYLVFYRHLTTLALCASFGLASMLTYVNAFHALNNFLSQHDLYPFWFKTSPDGKNVVSFQYARVYLLMLIMGCFYAAMWKKEFRSFDRVLWAWTFAALCVFSFCMHRVVGRMAFTDYQFEINAKIERVLRSTGSLKQWACLQEGFVCTVLQSDEAFKGSKPKTKNKLWPEVDSSHAIDEQMNKQIVDPLKNTPVGQPLVVSENALGQNNIIRSVAFGGVNLPDGKRLVLLDYDQTAKALDLYLVFFTGLMCGFLLVWGAGLYKLKSFHEARGIR
jgi:hypothetical protein